MIQKQFTLYLENKPGALARVTRKLAASNINIEGISVADGIDVALIQIVVSRPRQTGVLLKKAGIPYTVQDVALIKLKNEPGALSAVVSRLAREGVNINYVYATGSDPQGVNSYAIISAPDLARVEKVLK